MAETLGQVLNYINEVLPNVVNTTTKIAFINDEIKEFWNEMSSTVMYKFQCSSGVTFYDLPTTDYKVNNLITNGVQIAATTGEVSSTTLFNQYYFKGSNDDLSGNCYFEGLGKVGIYPTPDSNYYGTMKLLKYPHLMSSTDTNTEFDLDPDYIKLIKYRAMARVAKTGNFPRVDLANNYMMDANTIEAKMKLKSKLREGKNIRKVISYSEGWDD